MQKTPAQVLREEQRFDLCLRTAFALTVTPDNPLPELISLLGYELTMHFILVFGGQNFRVPSAKDVARPLNVAGAALRVFNREMTLQQASKKFGVPVVEVSKCLQVLQEEHKLVSKAKRDLEEAIEDLQEQQDST